MGKFFKKESSVQKLAYTQVVRPVVKVVENKVKKKSKDALDTAKKHPVKTTGGLLGWVFSPGEELAHLTGYGDRVSDNSLFEDFVTFGYPVGDVVYDAIKSGTISPGETYIDAAGKKRTRPYCDNWPGGCAAEERRLRQKLTHGKGPNEVRPLEESEMPR